MNCLLCLFNDLFHSMWHVCCETRENVTCEARQLQQIAISCKRSDYNMKKSQNSTLSILMSKSPKQVSLFFEAAHFMSSEVIDIHEFMSSTSGHSTATMKYWMKKTNANSDTGRRESVQVALLQILGGDGGYLSVLLGSLIGVSSVDFCQMCSARYTIFLDIFRALKVMGEVQIFCTNLFPLKFFLKHLLLALWASKSSFCASVLPCRAPRSRPFLMT